MATTNKFKINGLIDTNENVLDNLNQLANVSGCYLTWDPSQGKWIVILNTTSASVKTFDDSNIIGEINVGGTGVNELYNSVIARFPNKNTRDTVDVVQLTVPTANRFAQELDNVLELSIPIVNEPVQAAYIASRELKQSRLDKIIEFRANFEANTVRAGDVIDITNIALDFSGKLFRVIQIDEEDEDDGNLIFSITAQEYDANIYDETVGFNNATGTSGLTYEYTSNFTGIKSKILSEELDLKDNISAGKQIGGLLAANAALGLINSLFTVDEDTGAIINEGKFADPVKQSLMSTLSCPDVTASIDNSQICDYNDLGNITLSYDCSDCFFKLTRFVYTYEITGLSEGDIDIPLTGYCSPQGSGNSFSTALIVDANGVGSTPFAIRGTNVITSDKNFTVSINNGDLNHSVTVTGTLIAVPPRFISVVGAGTPADGNKGSTITLPVTLGGLDNWNIGDTIDYTISDPAGIVTTPLTGTISVTSVTSTPHATISVATQDDLSCGTATVAVTLTHPDGAPPSCVGADNSQSIQFYETANAVKLVSAVASPDSITEGGSTTVTLTSQNAANGTTVNYTISNSISKVTTPLTGTVTLNSNTASLTINTSDDGTYTGESWSIVVTFDAIGSGCSNATETISISEASAAPPADYDCQYVQVPIVWCGRFDGTTQYLKSVTVKKYAMLPLAPVGGVAVPTSLSITNPGEASAAISIGSTVNVDPASLGIGGAQFEVITSGFTALGGGDTTITGTTTILNGYW